MSARSLAHRLRTIAFYRDEIAIVGLGLAHQALTAGMVVPGLTVAHERAMVVRIADVHAAAPVHVVPGVRYDARAHVAMAPSATFSMPSLPVPELEAMRALPRAVSAGRASGGSRMPHAVRGRHVEVGAPTAPRVRRVPVAPVTPTADLSESALRAALEHSRVDARVEARVRAAVARALAAEQAARRLGTT